MRMGGRLLCVAIVVVSERTLGGQKASFGCDEMQMCVCVCVCMCVFS